MKRLYKVLELTSRNYQSNFLNKCNQHAKPASLESATLATVNGELVALVKKADCT